MTLRMADGPPSNLPPGLDAYAGYVNMSGIGITYPAVVAKYPKAQHLSITTNGSPAMCADVEKGAMTDWRGYDYGYCSVSMVNNMIATYGRPRKLWTSHYDPRIGAHICSRACWPDLITTADGTQWINHGGAWDESLLSDDFFDLNPAPAIPEGETIDMQLVTIGQTEYLISNVVAKGNLVQVRQTVASLGTPSNGQNTSVINLTAQWPAELSDVTG